MLLLNYVFIIPCILNSFNRRNIINYGLITMNSKNVYNYKLPNLENEDGTNVLLNYNQNNLYFQGPITQASCFHIQQYLLKMQYENFDNINFYIQSMGGALLPTLGLVDNIKNSNIPINTYINGFVASAGSLISVSGNTRYISKNSMMLIHSLRTTIGEVNFKELEDNYLNSKTMMNLVKNIYKEKSYIDDITLDFLLQHDYWLNSTECLKYQLVDYII